MEGRYRNRKIGWPRAIVFFVGMLLIIMPAIAVFTGFSFQAVAKLFFASIMCIGIVGIIRGFSPADVTGMELPPIRRNFELALGMVGVMLAVTGLLYTGWTIISLVYLAAFSFIVLGIKALLAGLTDGNLKAGSRVAMAALGMAAVAVSSAVFLCPMIGVAPAEVLLASSLALLGLQMVVSAL